MTELRIRNWDKWQSYRADRGQPPWIKVHRCVMRDPNWVELTDAERGQIVAIWLLAADRNGVIPASSAIIKKLCFMDSEPDLKNFIDKGFIEPDANVTPRRRQDDVLEKSREETETETEKRREEREAKPRASRARDCFIAYARMASEIGVTVPRQCTPGRLKKIEARLEDHGIDGWQQVLDSIRSSSFLQGKAKGDRDWRVDLDWLIKPDNFAKVIEGNYADRDAKYGDNDSGGDPDEVRDAFGIPFQEV